MYADHTDCFVCAGMRDSCAARWHDTPLVTLPGVGAVFPGIGPFLPGYVLVSPVEHVAALSMVPLEPRVRLGRLLLDFVTNLHWEPERVTFWEHGGSGHGRRSSACLFHAHLHVMPGRFDPPSDLPEPQVEYCGLESFLHDADAWQREPYLLFGRLAGPCWVSADPEIPQYFRRHIARLMGVPGEWDYAAAPRYDVVRSTVDLVRGIMEVDGRYGEVTGPDGS